MCAMCHVPYTTLCEFYNKKKKKTIRKENENERVKIKGSRNTMSLSYT